MYVSYTRDLSFCIHFQRSAAKCSPALYHDGSTFDRTEKKYDPLRVQISNCFQHLLNDVTGIHFGVVGLFDDSLQQFPAKCTNSKRIRICYRSIITMISSSLSKMSWYSIMFLWWIEVNTSGSKTSNPVGLQNCFEITFAQRFSLVFLSKMDTILATGVLHSKKWTIAIYWAISWSTMYRSKNSENGLKRDFRFFSPRVIESGNCLEFVFTWKIRSTTTQSYHKER